MKVSLSYSENMHFTASVRHFKNIHVDESEAFHGDDLAPSPIEYVLIGTGGCIASTFVFCMQKNKVLIEKLEVDVEGILKHSGSNNSLKLIKITVELFVTLKEGESSEKIDVCRELLINYCPIFNAVNSGIPLNINISNQKSI
jgi:putative redox protein